MKFDFEAAVIIAINKPFADSVVAGCNFHFKQYPWEQLQKYWSYCGIQRISTIPTRTQKVCCSDTPTYQ
jgi:hypothetical protein